jgi:hypothetical protein
MTQSFANILVEVGRLRAAFQGIAVAAQFANAPFREAIRAARDAQAAALRRQRVGDHECVFTLDSPDCQVCGEPSPLEVRVRRLYHWSHLQPDIRAVSGRRYSRASSHALDDPDLAAGRRRLQAVDDTLGQAAAWETIWERSAHRNPRPEPGPLVDPPEVVDG